MTVAIARPRGEDAADDRHPDARLRVLFDPGTLLPLRGGDGSAVLTARGLIGGSPAVGYCTDPNISGGALGATGCQHIVDAIQLAKSKGWPAVGLWHSGGAKLADGVESMDGVARVFAAITRASGRIPQISVVLGPAAGAASYGPALTDLIVMSGAGRMFVTGPQVVRAVTGEQVDMESLGGPRVHGRDSGVAHVVTESEPDAIAHARRLVTLFARPGRVDLDAVGPGDDLRGLLPASARRAYDVRPLVRRILDRDGDAGTFQELQPRWAPNIVIGLGRLAGRTVGAIANNPLRKGGCLDSLSAEKAARFVRMCDALGVPLLVIVDVPGYLPGLGQERGGVIRRGAKLLHAFAAATVPRVTLVTRKAYGGAYIAMNSRALGATTVYAWPDAEVAVMGAAAAVDILHRKVLAATPERERAAVQARLVAEHIRVSGGVRRALDLGVVDAVIDPAETRLRLASALHGARETRGELGNIPL